jgi:hypothetical protein
MDFALERLVFCHDLINPPAQSRSSYGWLDLVKSAGTFDITKLDDDSSESRYLVRIPNGHNLGITTSEQGELENEFMNLLLAINLSLNRICVTNKKVEFLQYDVTPNQAESKTNVTKMDGGHHIHSEETVVLREEAHGSVYLQGLIEERKVLEIFQRIQKLRRFERKLASDLRNINLGNAMSHYENGIVDFDRIIKFKHFFNSLELTVNMSGVDNRGHYFDNEVKKISSASSAQAREWREFYNRIKHVQQEPNDVNHYYRGLDTLPEKLRTIRPVINEVLLSKL